MLTEFRYPFPPKPKLRDGCVRLVTSHANLAHANIDVNLSTMHQRYKKISQSPLKNNKNITERSQGKLG